MSHAKWCNTTVETTVSAAADTFPGVNGYTMLSKINSGIILSFTLLTLDTPQETNCFISTEKELRIIFWYGNALLCIKLLVKFTSTGICWKREGKANFILFSSAPVEAYFFSTGRFCVLCLIAKGVEYLDGQMPLRKYLGPHIT